MRVKLAEKIILYLIQKVNYLYSYYDELLKEYFVQQVENLS
jgi:hypothetical protein